MTVPETAEPSPEVPEPPESSAAGLPVVPSEEAEPRRYPSTIGGAFYLMVLLVSAAGIGVVAVDDWRLGIRIVGGALIGAAALRLGLPARDAGMLAVRSRLLDALLLGAVGGILIFLTVSIPNQPG